MNKEAKNIMAMNASCGTIIKDADIFLDEINNLRLL